MESLTTLRFTTVAQCATTEEIARWAGEESERVVTHPESGDPLVRLRAAQRNTWRTIKDTFSQLFNDLRQQRFIPMFAG